MLSSLRSEVLFRTSLCQKHLDVDEYISNKLKFTLGANNPLNEYPTAQTDGWTDQGGLADSVQMGSDGRYIFSRIGFKF